MGDIVAFTPERVLDANGNPVSGAEARFYLSGTSTPAIVYSDSAETVPHPTPIVTNAAGVFPAVYRSGVALKVDVVDAVGGALPGYPIDPVRVTGINSTQAAGVSFAATDDIPANEVQTAIELVRASVLTPVANVGLGIGGLAPELADFNATNTKAGHYRFTGTTVGTRPATWSAGNVGTVSIYRHDSANAVMVAVETTTNETAQRVLTAGVWGAWSIILNSSLLQTTPNDFAAGKVPLAAYAHPNTIGTLINSATNINTLTTPGKYYFTNVSRPTNLPSNYDGAWAGTVIVSKTSDTTSPQMMLQEVHATKGTFASVNTASSWRRMTDGTFRTAWGMVYNQANILDTVSQASGVPTGGLIETGSNTNGRFTRFADGTQICWASVNVTPVANTPTSAPWVFPAAFSGAGASDLAIMVSHNSTVPGSTVVEVSFSNPTATGADIFIYRTTTTLTAIRCVAIGRWF